MVDRQKNFPKTTAAASRALKEREQRLAAALRANLTRRKAQSRYRAEAAAAETAAPETPRDHD